MGYLTFFLELNVNGLGSLGLESVVIPRTYFFNALMVLWKILGRDESVTVLTQDVDSFRAIRITCCRVPLEFHQWFASRGICSSARIQGEWDICGKEI